MLFSERFSQLDHNESQAILEQRVYLFATQGVIILHNLVLSQSHNY